MHRTSPFTTTCVLAILAFVIGCSQGSAPQQSSTAPGTLLQDPTSADGFTYFLADSNFNGSASLLFIEKVVWGRLVDLYAEDPASGDRMKVMRDLLVDQTIQSDGTNYLLQQNPVTLREQLVILHPFGSPAYELAFQPLRDDVGLGVFINKGVSANELPPFTVVPRNASISVQFNDLLDPTTVNETNLKVLVGYPPTAPFEARVVPDRSHGGLVNGVMRSTRIIVDPTVSQDDAQALGLKVNASGFPVASSTLLINVALRIPTIVNPTAGQFNLVRNLSGHSLSFTGNGSADSGSPTLDVVRGFRSGGPSLVTGDPYNGYLLDNDPPEIMGTQQVLVDAASGPVAPGQFLMSMTFASTACAIQPRVGDLIVVQNGVLDVLSAGDPLVGGSVTNFTVQRVDESFDLDEVPVLGPADFRTPWTSGQGFLPACFVAFNPTAQTPPATGVSTNATVRLSFSEPMDSVRTNGFDGIQVSDPLVVGKPLSKTVVGLMAPNQDLTSFVLEPAMPFKHTNGATETFNIDVISFDDILTGITFGVTDLAGNVVADNLPQVPFTLASVSPTQVTGSFALRFNNPDEDGNTFPEVRGQVVPNLLLGVMQTRAVNHFSAFMDPTPLAAVGVQNMTPLGGVAEPLSIYGSRTMGLWRYTDMGIPALEENSLNLDVEGLAWMIFGSGVSGDFFPDFSLSLAHSRFVPDEVTTVLMSAPPQLMWPSSGLTGAFAANVADALVTVSPQSNGYLIQAVDTFKTPSDSLMAPYPLNRNMPPSQYTYWTWRDTANLAVGGPFGGSVAGYAASKVPTLGLPLLMDFKTYPAPTQAQGFNRLFLSGVNTATNLNFNLPFFRAHSTGGILPDLSQKLIDPDTQVTAVGGLTAAGVPTPPVDNGFYYGTADFVTRVSQMHTIWFDTTGPSQFNNLVTIPTAADVPAGLTLSYAFRGATNITGTAGTPWTNADILDPYGDPKSGPGSFNTPQYLNGDATWKSNLSDLNGARFIQIRVTMIANAETEAVAEIDAMGFSYSQ